jgi:hypothetical protein
MRMPRYYNTMFGEKVRNAMESGELTYNNISEWDRGVNDGRDPIPPFNTKEIMDYYLQEKEEELYESVMCPFDEALGEWHQGGMNEYL